MCNRGSCNAITCWIPDRRRIVTAPRLGGFGYPIVFSQCLPLSLSVPFFLSILLYFLLLSLSVSPFLPLSLSLSHILFRTLSDRSRPRIPVRNVQREVRFGLQTFRAKWKRNNIMVIGALCRSARKIGRFGFRSPTESTTVFSPSRVRNSCPRVVARARRALDGREDSRSAARWDRMRSDRRRSVMNITRRYGSLAGVSRACPTPAQ